jgi:hypothetical protein
MQIDKAAIVLRPRGHWEAMDMGFLFARRHFLSLWLLWCATATPVFVLLHICLINYPEYVTLVFWWLKPLFEVLLVAWLGEALFNNPPTVIEQLKQFPGIVKQGFFSQLTWRRFSMSRSFNMPVIVLEHSHGSQLNQRLTTLQTTQPHSGWLTILLVHIETVFYFSIPVLVIMLMPGEVEIDYQTIFLSESDPYVLLENLVYFVSASLMAPFYVSAGFLLYINARTILEAWDIEIAFRQIPKYSTTTTNTVRAVYFALILSLTAFCITPIETQAATRDEAQQAISTVLESDDFGKQETITEWEPIFDNNKPNDTDFNRSWLNHLEWLGTLLKYLALICIAALAIWMAIKIAVHFDLDIFRRTHNKQLKTTALPEFLEIDDQQATLPANPVEAVTALCNQGRYREALSLLYRVSLIQFIEQHQVIIPTSATEQECLQIIKRHNDAALSRYFSALTLAWQWLAWAKQEPSEATIRNLCNTWSDHFIHSKHGQ